tara:strand:+ start:6423 stop:7055 length:633 start_codon:yes stop_codon:yes gene_type:complete
MYKVYDFYLNIMYSKYKSYDNEKKQYIIKNTMKSGALYGLSIISPPIIYSLIVNDNYYNYNLIIQIGAIIYTINDTVALYKLKNLSNSTKYHHIVSTSFGIISIFTDFYSNDTSKLLFIYCISACLTYNVNLFMGMRFLLSKKDLITLQQKCLYSYTISCALNWGYHIYYLFTNNHTIPLVIYYLLICVLIYDDLKLIKWLYVYDLNKYD